jgi:hypothetical protein
MLDTQIKFVLSPIASSILELNPAGVVCIAYRFKELFSPINQYSRTLVWKQDRNIRRSFLLRKSDWLAFGIH